MNKPTFVAVALAFALSACVPATPVVSDFNGASVKLQTSQLADADLVKVETQAEADRICRQGGKRRAEYASTRNLPDYVSEHLYLCL